jgi:hypothetical protein
MWCLKYVLLEEGQDPAYLDPDLTQLYNSAEYSIAYGVLSKGKKRTGYDTSAIRARDRVISGEFPRSLTFMGDSSATNILENKREMIELIQTITTQEMGLLADEVASLKMLIDDAFITGQMLWEGRETVLTPPDADFHILRERIISLNSWMQNGEGISSVFADTSRETNMASKEFRNLLLQLTDEDVERGYLTPERVIDDCKLSPYVLGSLYKEERERPGDWKAIPILIWVELEPARE